MLYNLAIENCLEKIWVRGPCPSSGLDRSYLTRRNVYALRLEEGGCWASMSRNSLPGLARTSTSVCQSSVMPLGCWIGMCAPRGHLHIFYSLQQLEENVRSESALINFLDHYFLEESNQSSRRKTHKIQQRMETFVLRSLSLWQPLFSRNMWCRGEVFCWLVPLFKYVSANLQCCF